VSRPGLTIVADEAALAQLVAERFAAAAGAAIAARGRFAVALAGGSTPKAAYALLAREPLRSRVDWSRTEIFFSDERCVPPDDEASNYKMAAGALLNAVPLDPSRIFRMRGEAEPQAAAREYAALLTDRLGSLPQFDLLMLGMGPDGHTASLFPGSDPFADDAALVRAPFVPAFVTYRITLTPRAINAARYVQIATAGSAKAAALAAVLEGPYAPQTYPIQAVKPVSGDLAWLVDRAAAAALHA
jgi:6-phosphogluconolactonase